MQHAPARSFRHGWIAGQAAFAEAAGWLAVAAGMAA